MKKTGGSAVRKYLAFLLCALFLLCVVAGYGAMVLHDDHECHDDHCAICVTLDHVRSLLRQMQGAGAVFCAVSLHAAAGLVCLCGFFAVVRLFTPVALRVRMDH